LETFISFFASKFRFDFYTAVNKGFKMVFYFKISAYRLPGSVIKMILVLTLQLHTALCMISNWLQFIFLNILYAINMVIKLLPIFYSHSKNNNFSTIYFFQLRPQFLISNGRTF